MSRGFSRVVLVGNLGRDPEMRYSQNGNPITNFSLAVGRRRRGPDGTYQDETDWFRVTLFRFNAENAAEWLKKGSRVLVEGQLQIRMYTGNDGVERTSVDVLADSFLNLTPRDDPGDGSYRAPAGAGRQEQGRQSGAQPRPAPQPREDDFDDLDDVPF